MEIGEPEPIDVEGCEVGARPRPRAAWANAGDASGAGMEACCDGICIDPIGIAETLMMLDGFSSVDPDDAGAPEAVAVDALLERVGTFGRASVPLDGE